MATSRSDSDFLASQQGSTKPSRRQRRDGSIKPQSAQSTGQRRAKQRSAESHISASVHALQPAKKPLWLVGLLWLQQTSSIITLLLVIGILSTYGWTVYIQHRWGQQYEKLETLKQRERQLISANEVLKNQMADQAEKPTAGLLLPDPSNAIFLTPAPQRPELKPTPIPAAKSSPTKPLGY
jgi:hypothetical protein